MTPTMRQSYPLLILLCLWAFNAKAQEGMIMTVKDPILPSEMGPSLDKPTECV